MLISQYPHGIDFAPHTWVHRTAHNLWYYPFVIIDKKYPSFSKAFLRRLCRPIKAQFYYKLSPFASNSMIYFPSTPPFCDIRLTILSNTIPYTRAQPLARPTISSLHRTITHILYHLPRLRHVCPIHTCNVCKAIFSNITIISKIFKCFIPCTESLKDSEMKYTFSFQL